MSKNNLIEKQIDAEIQATLKHVPVWKLTEEKNANCYKLQKQIRIINYNYLHSNISYTEVICDKVVLKNFAKITEKRMCQSLFFKKVSGLRQFY